MCRSEPDGPKSPSTLEKLNPVYRDWLRLCQFEDTEKHRWEFKQLVLRTFVKMNK
jgi:hypothetical protein